MLSSFRYGKTTENSCETLPPPAPLAASQSAHVDKRKKEAMRIRAKYPDKVPIIVENDDQSKEKLTLKERKFLVPASLTMGAFIYVLRKRMKLPAEKALFVFVNNQLPPTAALMALLDAQHRSEDGFLYVSVSGENVFG